MKRRKLDKEIQHVWFEEERNAKKCDVGVKFRAQGDKKFFLKKKKPQAKRNKWSSVLGKRPHPAKIPTYERNLGCLISEGNQQQQKADANVIESPAPAKENH